MESIGIVCGIVLGLFGSVFSVVQFFYQKHKDKEQTVKEAEREAKAELKDRLAFLMQVIIDKDIPRESRQPFYDEYIAKGGNGTAVKFWLQESVRGAILCEQALQFVYEAGKHGAGRGDRFRRRHIHSGDF